MKWLYHLAEADNLDSILQRGLMSSKRLVGMVNLPERERKTLLRNHRPECVRLAKGVLIRDQRPMPPTALSRALDEDLKPIRFQTEPRNGRLPLPGEKGIPIL